MTAPKLHHYVPQFYLRRFADARGRLWVWDKESDRTFGTGPGSIAAGTNFYYVDELANQGHDPLELEKQLSDVEGDAALVTDEWIGWVREELYDGLHIPDANREAVSLFVAIQGMRTDDVRSLLAAFSHATAAPAVTEEARRALHVHAMWNTDLVQRIADRIYESTWVFGHNKTSTPFITSDNPVTYRTNDNRQWLRGRNLLQGVYLAYPLAPDVIMFCYPDEGVWRDAGFAEKFDCAISPVEFTDRMVQDENTGQVFMASRFVMSVRNEFEAERDFRASIGTDRYKPTGGG